MKRPNQAVALRGNFAHLLAGCALFAVTHGAADAQAVVESAEPSARADSASDPSGPAEAEQSAEGLQDIVVTAQRQKETSQRAAVAITAVGGEDLVNAGINDISRLDELVPGLEVATTGTSNTIFLRGVGTFVATPVADAAIAVNYDGVYTGRAASGFNFFDLERIEVLKGPQGTLYGRNATGGAINIIPARPKLGEVSGYATASIGNYDDFRIEGGVSVPLGERSAVRLAGSRLVRDGYLHDGTNDDDTTGARLQFLTELSPELTVRLAGDYTHVGGAGAGSSYLGRYAFGPTGYKFIPSNLADSEGLFTPASQAFRQTVFIPPSGRFAAPLALAGYPQRDNNFYGLNAEIEYETGAGTFTFIPAWRRGDINSRSSTPSFQTRNLEKIDQYSAELRFAGDRVGIFDYILGGYLYNEKIDNDVILAVSAQLTVLKQKLETNSLAPFARITAHLNENLRLVGGIRYTRDKKTFLENQTVNLIICPPPGIGRCPGAPQFGFISDVSELPFALPARGGAPVPVGGGAIAVRSDRLNDLGRTNERVTWRAAVEYDVAPRSLLYASVETGFRSGGFSGSTGFETFEPEYIKAYTIGSKNRFFDNRLQLNVEAFYWDYTNQQIFFVGADANGNAGAQVRNIGSSKIKGFEVETQLLVTPTTLLHANVQYLDTKAKFVYQVPAAGPPPVTACAVGASANPRFRDVNCAGFPAYNSPKWTLNLAAQQTIELGNYKLVLSADTQYKSSRFPEFNFTPESRIGSTWRSNAQVTFMTEDERMSLAAFVLNIEGERTPSFVFISPLTNFLVSNPTPPTTYGVRASVKF